MTRHGASGVRERVSAIAWFPWIVALTLSTGATAWAGGPSCDLVTTDYEELGFGTSLVEGQPLSAGGVIVERVPLRLTPTAIGAGGIVGAFVDCGNVEVGDGAVTVVATDGDLGCPQGDALSIERAAVRFGFSRSGAPSPGRWRDVSFNFRENTPGSRVTVQLEAGGEVWCVEAAGFELLDGAPIGDFEVFVSAGAETGCGILYVFATGTGLAEASALTVGAIDAVVDDVQFCVKGRGRLDAPDSVETEAPFRARVAYDLYRPASGFDVAVCHGALEVDELSLADELFAFGSDAPFFSFQLGLSTELQEPGFFASILVPFEGRDQLPIGRLPVLDVTLRAERSGATRLAFCTAFSPIGIGPEAEGGGGGVVPLRNQVRDGDLALDMEFDAVAAILVEDRTAVEFGFTPCADRTLRVGETLEIPVDCVLRTTDPAPGGLGPRGWTAVVGSEVIEIIEITTQGTVAALDTDEPPGLRDSSGFEFATIAPAGTLFGDGCEEGPVAVFGAFLSESPQVTLPVDSPQTIARLTLGVTGDGEPRRARIRYLESCDAGEGVEETLVFFPDPETSSALTLGECAFELLPAATICPANPVCSVVQREGATARERDRRVRIRFDRPEGFDDLLRYDVYRNGTYAASISPFRSDFEDLPPFGLGFLDTDVVFTYTIVPIFGPGPVPPVEDLEDAPLEGAPCAPLVCDAVISPGEVTFSETFDEIAEGRPPTDADLIGLGWAIADTAAGADGGGRWTVENPDGLLNPPGLTGRATTGAFLISDGSPLAVDAAPGSGRAHDAITPPFDCSLLDDVWLHADVLLQFAADDAAIFEIAVSTDGGATWSAPLFQRVAPTRRIAPLPTRSTGAGVYGQINVSLTDLAAGEPLVRVRFRHLEPSRESIVLVDNVVVDDVVPPQARIPLPDGVFGIGPTGDEDAVILFGPTGFDGGIPLADGWTIDSFVGNALANSWTGDDPCARSAPTDEDVAAGAPSASVARRIGGEFSIVDAECTEDDDPPTKAPEKSDEVLTSGVITIPPDAVQVLLVYEDEGRVTAASEEQAPSHEVFLELADTGQGCGCIHESTFSDTGFRAGLDTFGDIHGYYLDLSECIRKAETAGLDTSNGLRVRIGFRYAGLERSGWWMVDNFVVFATSLRTQFQRGDSNCDGAANLSDALGVLDALFQAARAEMCCTAAANVSGDDRVDLTDPIYLLNYLFIGGPEPAAPFEACGGPVGQADLYLGCAEETVGCRDAAGGSP